MEWLTFARLLAINLREVVRLDGTLDATVADARELRLLVPPTPTAELLDAEMRLQAA
jgi:hypothetical protein